jgi:hypothetical protein
MDLDLDLDLKLNKFEILVNNYTDTISSLLDLAVSNKLVPLKIIIGLPLMKDYIIKNRIDILEYGIKYILSNKEDILNFNINKLDELDKLDSDSDDNISRQECMSNIKTIKSSTHIDPINNFDSNEILDIIIQIKNNSKKLDDFTIQMIRSYVELLLLILEQIKMLF